MDRRGFISAFTGGLFAAPFASEAQQGRPVRLGWLAIEPLPDRLEVFRQGLGDLGYIEHKNLVLDERYAYGRAERLADLAAELLRLKPDALLTIGTPAVWLPSAQRRHSRSSSSSATLSGQSSLRAFRIRARISPVWPSSRQN